MQTEHTYTTGELAKACGISVRTVQYYDERGILIPSSLTGGGRRIYTEADLGRMKIICFLRELELPIEDIKALLSEENPERFIEDMLCEKERILREETAEKQARADRIADVRRSLNRMGRVSVESIGDVAQLMETKKELSRLRLLLIFLCLPCNAVEIATIAVWIATGNWVPFAVGIPLRMLVSALACRFYMHRVDYICPACHTSFRPRMKESFFASHTPTARDLTCPYCGRRGFCTETYRKES